MVKKIRIRMAGQEVEYDEVLGERLVNEEYKIWKRNTPFLYDLVITHALEWPSLTVQWLPDRVEKEDSVVQELILGTHTADGEQNHLMRVQVELPLEETETDHRQYNDATGEVGGFGASVGRIQTVQCINHGGEVNRARSMPQNKFMIATKTPEANVLVFDWSKHGSRAEADGIARPDIRLLGHNQEGYGLMWSPAVEGRLLSGSDDAQVCLWDVGTASGPTLDASAIFLKHTGVVEDVAWHSIHPHMFGSVGDDRLLVLWDARLAPARAAVSAVEAHDAEINCIAFNPVNEYVLATGSADKTVVLRDIRRLDHRLHVFENHTDEVFQVSWMPQNETILSSCGADRRLMIWDLAKIGADQDPEDAEDGPPELLFVHGGHTSKVSDFAWNPVTGAGEWMVASVAEDNILQIWQMAEDIYAGDDLTVHEPGKEMGATVRGKGQAVATA